MRGKWHAQGSLCDRSLEVSLGREQKSHYSKKTTVCWRGRRVVRERSIDCFVWDAGCELYVRRSLLTFFIVFAILSFEGDRNACRCCVFRRSRSKCNAPGLEDSLRGFFGRSRTWTQYSVGEFTFSHQIDVVSLTRKAERGFVIKMPNT